MRAGWSTPAPRRVRNAQPAQQATGVAADTIGKSGFARGQGHGARGPKAFSQPVRMRLSRFRQARSRAPTARRFTATIGSAAGGTSGRARQSPVTGEIDPDGAAPCTSAKALAPAMAMSSRAASPRIADIARLHQHRGQIGRFQHDKGRRLQRPVSRNCSRCPAPSRRISRASSVGLRGAAPLRQVDKDGAEMSSLVACQVWCR